MVNSRHSGGIQFVSYGAGKGFALHKVTGDFSGRCSGYYDKNGNLLDAEQLVGGYPSISRPVKRGGPLWDYLNRIGKRYV